MRRIMRRTTVILFLLIASPALTAGNDNDSRLQSLQMSVSAQRIEADIGTLVGFGTRHTLSETISQTRGIGAARRWVKAEFEAISSECRGCLEVIYVSDFVEGENRIPDRSEVVSVLAIQRGRLDPDRMVVMSGDIDSRVTDPMNATADNPGANDNASGLAGVIEAARVLSQEKFAGTIVYAALAGEEQGLFGGKIVAAHALEQGWRISKALTASSTMQQRASFPKARAMLRPKTKHASGALRAARLIARRAISRVISIGWLTNIFPI